MTDVTRYQLFLDYFKLVLRLKEVVDELKFSEVVNEVIEKLCKNEITEEEKITFRDFLINLNQENFYDNCMQFYLNFIKNDNMEDSKINPNIEFMKIQLCNYLLS